jgi:hypothetical protein
LGLACAGSLFGAADFQSLVDRSPFSPPQGAVNLGATEEQAGPLEFRGLVVDEQGTAYSIFDATSNKGSWLRVDEQNGIVQVKSYDEANSVLEVVQNGKPLKLALKRSTIQAGPSLAAMIPPPAPAGGAAQQQRPGEVKRDPAADAKRLESVAAEVRRRRALRNAAQPGAAQPATPAPAPAPAAQ